MATFGLEHVGARESEVTIVSLAGELDLTNVEEFDERLAAVADGHALVIDLNGLVFADSAALNRLFRIARERGAHVAFVIEPASPVAATLAIVEFGRAATLVATREDAVTALGRAGSA